MNSYIYKCLSKVSKHLTGQLEPRVRNVTFFCIKGGQLEPRVCNLAFICTKGGQLGPHICYIRSLGVPFSLNVDVAQMQKML